LFIVARIDLSPPPLVEYLEWFYRSVEPFVVSLIRFFHMEIEVIKRSRLVVSLRAADTVGVCGNSLACEMLMQFARFFPPPRRC